MMSKLPYTGKCYYCGEPTDGRYCSAEHGSLYRASINNPKRPKTKSYNKRGQYTKNARYGGWKPSGLPEAERIKNVVRKAIDAGTCFNHATLAPGA